MALEIINGIRDVGKLGSDYYSPSMEDFIMTLRAGNTVVERGTIPFLSFIAGRTLVTDREAGKPIPVERFNVYFTSGGYTTNGYGFEKYYSKFVLPEDTGMTAITYNFSEEEILKAREKRIDLNKKVLEQIQAYMSTYQNLVLPYKNLQTLITGSSLSLNIPTEATATSDDKYERAFGFLRGEDVSGFVKEHLGITHACHYRGTKGETFAISDIYDAVDVLASYKDSSGEKPYALANSRTILNTIASSLEWSANKDMVLVEGTLIKYKEAFGCRWIDMDNYLPEGIIIFIDSGALDLMVKTQSPDEFQRGIAFVKNFTGEMTPLQDATDLGGGQVKVFPSEQFILKRHSGLILDTTNQGKSELNKEGWADTATVTKLENYAKALRSTYFKEMK